MAVGDLGVDRVFEDGDTIVAEGDDGREMFIIRSGRVQITKRTDQGEITLAHLERGNFFGEMSLLESSARDASAFAVGKTRLLAIQPGQLLIRIRRDPTFAMEMLHRLSGRLRRQNARLIGALDRLDVDSDQELEAVLMADPDPA